MRIGKNEKVTEDFSALQINLQQTLIFYHNILVAGHSQHREKLIIQTDLAVPGTTIEKFMEEYLPDHKYYDIEYTDCFGLEYWNPVEYDVVGV